MKVEKMSKNKPEIGDIWEIYDPNAGTYKAIVINTSDFVHPYCITEDFQGVFLWGYTTETYLGKSKIDVATMISSLFSLEDKALANCEELKINNKLLLHILRECALFFEEENPKDFTVHSERMSELLNLINSIVKGD